MAVRDPPRRAAVLPPHLGRFAAFLEETGLVDHQHRRRIAELLHHVGPQVVAHRIRVPPRPGQQALHPGRCRLPRPLGQLPAVLALDRLEQPFNIGPHPTTRLRPPESRGQPPVQRLELRRPIRHRRFVHQRRHHHPLTS